MICYFQKGFKLSIKVKIEQRNQESINLEEIVQKAVNIKAKAGLRSKTMVQDLDICCAKDHRFSNSTVLKVQTQGTTGKECKPKKFRPKELKSAKSKNPALPCSKSTELGKTSHIYKKSEYLKKKRDRKNNTLVTRDNANAIEVGEKKRNN